MGARYGGDRSDYHRFCARVGECAQGLNCPFATEHTEAAHGITLNHSAKMRRAPSLKSFVGNRRWDPVWWIPSGSPTGSVSVIPRAVFACSAAGSSATVSRTRRKARATHDYGITKFHRATSKKTLLRNRREGRDAVQAARRFLKKIRPGSCRMGPSGRTEVTVSFRAAFPCFPSQCNSSPGAPEQPQNYGVARMREFTSCAPPSVGTSIVLRTTIGFCLVTQ